MDLICKNVLAGTALAGKENHRIAGGCALRLLQQPLHHGIVRFEDGDEFASREQYRTILIVVFFVHRRPLIQMSVPAFKPDNVHAKTFRATQQFGINRAPK